jgi:hypothetical protein
MKTSEIFYYISFLTGIFLLVAGIVMKFFSFEDYGWFFSKRGELSNGILDGNGTIILGVITLLFALVHKQMFNQKKESRERQINIEKNEEKLRKKYNIYKIRKANKK